ncbi:MAG: TIGR04013 family B12-binding domain/radical SAM domain-containing protein [Endomicrobiia bacterium]
MKNDTAIVFYYTNLNRYSYNALMGALDTDPYFNDLKIYCIRFSTSLVSQLNEIIKKHKKVIVGISFFTVQKEHIKEFVKYLKNKHDEKLFFISGGPHPTGEPEETLKMGFDIVICGEGEETLKQVLKSFDNEKSYEDIKGICFFDNNKKLIFTGKPQQINLDKYPPVSIKQNHFGPIEITRGCVFGCYFCQTTYMFGEKLRHRSIKNIIRYVKHMADIGLKDFRAISPNAFSYGSPDGKKINYSAIEELLWNIKKIVKPLGKVFFGTFPSEVRPEHVNPETLKLILKYADNDNLVIGAQTGSQRILDLCHRGHSVEDIFCATELILKNGLKAKVDFIFGLPEEREEDVNETIKVIKQLIKMGAKIHAHTFSPLPQTPFARKNYGKISEELKELIKEYLPKGYIYGNNFVI